MFHKIDRYIIRKFLGTFFFIMAMLMSIAIVFDFAEKFDDFYNFGAPIGALILDYYVNFVFYYSNLFSSLLVFIAVIYFVSKMAKDNEIVAILSSGMSYNRMLLPFFLAASVIVVSSVLLNHFVLPSANKTRLEFEERYTHHPLKLHNIHREVKPGIIVYFSSNENGVHESLSIEKWEKGSLKSSLNAQRAYYDTIRNVWTLNFYFSRTLGEDKDSIARGDNLDTILPFKPSDFGYRVEFVSSMSSPDLKKFIEQERNNGSNSVVFSEIELYQRTAYPIAAYILTLIGVSVAGRKSRGGMGLNLAVGLGFAVTYIFSMKMTTVAATNAGLSPILAVWIPNGLFLILTIPLYKRAQK